MDGIVPASCQHTGSSFQAVAMRIWGLPPKVRESPSPTNPPKRQLTFPELLEAWIVYDGETVQAGSTPLKGN